MSDESEENQNRDWVEQSKHGNEEAFRHLFEAYYMMIYHFCYRLTLSRQTAQDLAQITFIKAARKISTCQSQTCFRSWLFKIASKKQFNNLANWGPGYSQSFALWNFLDLVDSFASWPAGQGAGFWSQYARTLVEDANPEVRLLGLHLAQKDAHSIGEKVRLLSLLTGAFHEHWFSDTTVIGYRSRMEIIETAFRRVPTIKGLRHWQKEPNLWLSDSLDNHPHKRWASGCYPYWPMSEWKPPGSLGGPTGGSSTERITASFYHEMAQMREKRLETMARTGGAKFFSDYFLGFKPEEAKRLEPVLGQAVEKIQERANALSEPKIIKEFREEFVEKEFNPVLAKAGSSSSRLDPGRFHVPYLQYRKLAPDLPLPGAKEHFRSGRRWQTDIVSIPNSDDSLVRSGTGGYLIRFDPDSRRFHDPLLLPEPLMVGRRPALGYHSTAAGQVLAVQAEYQRGQEGYFYGIACYEFSRQEWRLFQSPEFAYESSTLVGIPSIVILENNLYYFFASGPKNKGGDSSRDFWDRATTTMGIKKLNLITGEETFLANPRRNPPGSPLDGEKWNHNDKWMTRVSDTKLRFMDWVYDESKDEWEDVSGTTPVTENMQKNLFWEDFSIGWGIYNGGDQVLTLNVSTVEKDQRKGINYKGSKKVDLKVSMDDWQEDLVIPAQYPEVRQFYQGLKDEGMLDSGSWRPELTPQGIYLSNRLGFYFIPKSEVIEKVSQALKDLAAGHRSAKQEKKGTD